MFQVLFFYTSLYQVVLSSSQFSFIKVPNQRDNIVLVELVEYILSECKHVYTVYVYNNATEEFGFADILGNLKIPYEVRSQASQRRLPVAQLSFNDSPVFMLFTESVKNVLPIIENAMSSYLLTNRSKILVILDGQPEESETHVLFKSLWKHAILNIILISFGIDGSVRVFTYNPYRNEFLLEIPVQSKEVTYFPDKTRDLYGHKLRILYFKVVPDVLRVLWKGAYIWIGVTVEMAPVLVSYLNATPSIELNEALTFGIEEFVNESYSYVTGGLEQEIVRGTKDLCIRKSFIRPSLQFDYINPFDPQGKIVMVPRALPIPYYLTFFTTPKRMVGLGVIFSVAIVAVVLKLIFIVFGVKVRYVDLTFRTFATLMSQGGINVKPSFPVQIVVASWGLFCVVLMASISGEIIQSFIVTTYGNEINDVATAMRVPHWKFYTFEGYVKILLKSNEQYFKDRVRGLPKAMLYEKAFNATGHDGFIISKAVANYIIGKVGDDVYHKIDGATAELFSFYVKRGAPIFHTFKSFTKMLIASGLQQYWAEKTTWYGQQRKWKQVAKSSLTFNQFLNILLMLAIGLAISTIAFAFDHARAYFARKKLLKS